MRHGCNERCIIVREQLKKAREEGRLEAEGKVSSPDPNLREAAGPSTSQKTANDLSKRSKDSRKHPSGSTSPNRPVEAIRRSQPNLARGSPTNSRDAIRTFNPGRRSRESQTPRQEKKKRPSPKSTRNGGREPDEYNSGSSSRSNTGERIPNYAGRLKRGGVGGSRKGARDAHDDRRAGPSRKSRRRSEEDSESYSDCEPHCSGRSERMRKFKNKKSQEEFDSYLLYTKLPYFGDLCYCSYQCLVNQLWKDPFVKSTAASIAVFALGLKLCWELDGWTLPNAF